MPPLPADSIARTGFARSEHRDRWLRHPVHGDPSFNPLARQSGNPAHRGPAYGAVELLLDGRQAAQVDLQADTPLPPAPLLEAADLPGDFQAPVLGGTTGPVVLGSPEIHCETRSPGNACAR